MKGYCLIICIYFLEVITRWPRSQPRGWLLNQATTTGHTPLRKRDRDAPALLRLPATATHPLGPLPAHPHLAAAAGLAHTHTLVSLARARARTWGPRARALTVRSRGPAGEGVELAALAGDRLLHARSFPACCAGAGDRDKRKRTGFGETYLCGEGPAGVTPLVARVPAYGWHSRRGGHFIFCYWRGEG